jgi:diguanylate cyclase (GGDEF)-like protein
VTIDRTPSAASLLDAARIVARGADLDSKLGALADHAAAVSGAPFVLLALFDVAGGALVPAAAHGLEPDRVADATLPLGEDDPLAVGLAERRAETHSAPGGDAFRRLAALRAGTASLVVVPLVIVDDAGTEELQGALVCGYEDPVPTIAGLELHAVADLAATAIRLAQLEYALQERADWLERMAHTDALTGLANRRTFERMLELELARAARQGSPLSLVIFDVDRLRSITENAGARAGDDVLRRVASTLADQVRLVDTVARIGADEFAVIAPGALGGIVARRVRDAVAQLGPFGDERVSVSAGVAHFPEEASTATELLAAAEAACAEAQRQGAGTVIAAGEPEPDAQGASAR